jgi:predicted methyltransferase
MSRNDIDLRAAINAISEVVQNRPRPLREFDQIYMKTADMVIQSEIVADWADGKRLAFIGDGDAISVCIAYLQKRGIFEHGPSKIEVFDFDERICGAVERFADKERIEHLSSRLYNCLDAFPDVPKFDHFYTNPPWGASNGGESVNVFCQRGMEATLFEGEGLVVIADDEELLWAKQVLAGVQAFAIKNKFYTQKMTPRVHEYHLDDAPELRSCNLFFKSLPRDDTPPLSGAITDPERLQNFYGRENHLKVKYVREKKRLNYGKAHEDEYSLELVEESE